MSIKATDGSTTTISTEILDEFDAPVVPKPGYPKVALLDKDKSVIAQFSAQPGASVGTWESAVALPLLGVERPTEYRVRWRCMSHTGEKFQVFDTIIVEPKAERRDSEIVVMEADTAAEFVLPLRYTADMAGTYQIFRNNERVMLAPVELSHADVKLDAGLDRTLVSVPTVPVEQLPPALFANLLSVRLSVRGRPKTFSYKYWCITPQIALAMTMVEDFLNKSRIENVIPELSYTDGDIVGYLERGLNLFNTIGVTTNFTGTNMQGPLLDNWLICCFYWAIGSQLLAEGSLAFDFSGQGISLNVDRTPQLDSALGRIEARIQDTVLPFKKQLGSQGILGGSGAAGSSNLHNPYSSGTLSLINAATTRVNGWSSYIGLRTRS